MKKVAILGGAFDPIRLDHTYIAKFVLDNISEINEVWISPAYDHTFSKSMIDPLYRVKMCKLSITDPRIKVFDYEIHNKLMGGTLNFYKTLKNDHKFNDIDFYWIIGMDNANMIEKWVNWNILIKSTKFIVISREGIEQDKNYQWYRYYPHIFLTKPDRAESSSTKIRSLLNSYYQTLDSEILMEIKRDLHPLVLKYILKNKLYDQIS